MRSVETIKKQRNILRDSMLQFMKAKDDKFPSPVDFKGLSEFRKREYRYIAEVIINTRVQINVLEFVLNEDTEIIDHTLPTHFQHIAGVTKKEALNIGEE